MITDDLLARACRAVHEAQPSLERAYAKVRMKTIFVFSAITTVVIAGFFASCVSITRTQMYDGPTRSDAEVASIRKGRHYLEFPDRGGTFFVRYIIPPGADESESFGSSALVLPGTVEIGLFLERVYPVVGKQLVIALLKFEVEAGHEYLFHGFSGELPGAWAVDADTGEIVGSFGSIPDNWSE